MCVAFSTHFIPPSVSAMTSASPGSTASSTLQPATPAMLRNVRKRLSRMAPRWLHKTVEVVCVNELDQLDAEFLILGTVQSVDYAKLWINPDKEDVRFRMTCYGPMQLCYLSHYVRIRVPMNDAAVSKMGDADAYGEIMSYVGKGPAILTKGQVRAMAMEAGITI